MLNLRTISYLLLTVNLVFLIGLLSGLQAFNTIDSPWTPEYATAYTVSSSVLAPLKQTPIIIITGVVIVLQLYMTFAKSIKFLIPLTAISLFVIINYFIYSIIDQYPTKYYSDILYVLYFLNFVLVIMHFVFTSRYTKKYV